MKYEKMAIIKIALIEDYMVNRELLYSSLSNLRYHHSIGINKSSKLRNKDKLVKLYLNGECLGYLYLAGKCRDIHLYGSISDMVIGC